MDKYCLSYYRSCHNEIIFVLCTCCKNPFETAVILYIHQ